MRRAVKRAWLVLALLCGLWITSGCDWEYYALLNSVPYEGDAKENPRVFVYLCVDGVSYYAMKEAIAKGAFPASQWNLAKFITVFPGTSDVSWTRIFHVEPANSYEYQYYDAKQDKTINRGIMGIVKHALPFGGPPYYNAFDFLGNGYTNQLYAYQTRQYSFANTFENIFTLLAGRAETAKAFIGYSNELDIMGHMDSRENVVQALIAIYNWIEEFKQKHPRREFIFTLISDHGNDFIKTPEEKFIKFDKELEKVGVKPVYTFEDEDLEKEVVAIPIVHTRVTYIALHAPKSQIREVASRSSKAQCVDIAISKSAPPSGYEILGNLDWYAIWRAGSVIVSFGYDKEEDLYYLPSIWNYAAVDIDISFREDQAIKVFTDEELFEASKNRTYPDLFYRTRTALEKVGIKHPADILLSFKHPYASLGFEIPGGANEIASSGFHGAMDNLGTEGILLTEERDLPEAVRADTMLYMFPNLREHIETVRGMKTYVHDANNALDYR